MYQYVGTQNESLASGRPLSFGDVVEDALEPEDQRLVEAGLLIPAEAPEQPKAPAPDTVNASSKETNADASGS